MKNILVLCAALLCATALNLNAKTIKYPEKDPAFSITLPDDWTATPDKDGNLDCQSGDGSKFSFSIVPTKDLNTEADLKAYLPKLAKGMADGAKIENAKIGEMGEMTTAKKVKLFGLNANGPTSGIEMVITLAAFAPKKDTYFVIMAVEPSDVDKAHDKMMGEIINSITPL
jgi:hypothetical protein